MPPQNEILNDETQNNYIDMKTANVHFSASDDFPTSSSPQGPVSCGSRVSVFLGKDKH